MKANLASKKEREEGEGQGGTSRDEDGGHKEGHGGIQGSMDFIVKKAHVVVVFQIL